MQQFAFAQLLQIDFHFLPPQMGACAGDIADIEQFAFVIHHQDGEARNIGAFVQGGQ